MNPERIPSHLPLWVKGPPARGERGPGGHGLSCESETERVRVLVSCESLETSAKRRKPRLYIIAKDEGDGKSGRVAS